MSNAVKHLLEFGPFRIDPGRRLLLRDQQAIPLSPKAFDLLLALVEHSGELVLKDDLMKTLWPDTFVEESNLGQQVFQLRKALGERAQTGSYIVTVPGRGYRFAQTVRALPVEEEHIVVESRSRSRMVIEEKFVGGKGSHDSAVTLYPSPELQALPGLVSARWPRRGGITALVLLGATLGAIAVWIFRPVSMPKVARSVRITSIGSVEPFSQALTDGSRIFFTERMGGRWSLAQVSEGGGDAVLISTSVNNVDLLDIDRKHSRLLVIPQRPNADTGYALWEVPTSGGSGRRVGDLMVDTAAWSPGGENIVYSRANELFVVGDDGLQPRKLFSAPGVIEYLRWSPDGQHIGFTVRDIGGVLSLWEMSPDGNNPHSLSLGWKAPTIRFGEGECCGDWSPDGKYFIFRSLRDRVESVWLIKEKTSWFERGRNAPLQLYTSPDRLNEPRFSADGKKIILVHYQDHRELVRFDSKRKVFVPYLGGIPARHLSFSRDGQWVAYKNQLDGTLWRSRIDRSEALQLTFPPLDTYHPTWSPDGKRIAFEGNSRLYIVPFEGGKSEPVFQDEHVDRQPSWSPDGSSLLFLRQPGMEGTATGRICRVDLNTRQVRDIPGSQNFETPQWSPDGKYAAAADRIDQKLMLFDFNRQTWSELADGSPYGWGIRWSNDSKYVYYQHMYAGEEQPIFRVRVTDRKVEQITTSRQILSADVLSYAMTGLTPDNSPLASLARRNSDIYSLELDLP
jgi:Tol biopolymer transport system component/DNA-binding winged helix-turn-helix (wHTH) protein